MWLVLLLLLWLSPVAPNWETGSCSQPQPLCCLGIDNHCKSGNCYCDAFCHKASDCCPDHHALCSTAPQNTKMVLQMVLRMENPPSPKRSNLNRVQSMVSARRFSPKGWGQSAPASLASRPQSQGAIY
ncbi:PREDICTED: tubulointerstitial nephritis antigen-like isoform X2 [Myotis davidii]|uniref:tubulointerstitial nephritis antigen-like isoform X2 n=1 Tax=Myotis davidii TaxID=225400 RepID=UPI00076789F9|nr:PREDICTED: tubulointerstitial nephritis antigen-like isoform X2 [Myotis davidii]